VAEFADGRPQANNPDLQKRSHSFRIKVELPVQCI
jgi:hypothetical protein